ncbi:MAG TPA: sulfotransferase domain-containing protein [Caulobacteraceae bacterium]|nr:sulfotransferase domain-containing protein [Caulobacteraceae bacterium]
MTDAPAASKALVPGQGILWLASYPKSGNTWARVFLHNLFALAEGEKREYDINSLNAFTTWDISLTRYRDLLGRDPVEADRELVASLRPKVQEAIAAEFDGLAIVKTHHALLLDRGVPTINFDVTAGAVYIVRNPLDVAISFAHHAGVDVDMAIEDMALEGYETAITERSVHEVYSSWSRHVESWTRRPHRAIHVMRYEDMLERPLETFSALARHLLIPASTPQIMTAIDRASFVTLKAQEAAAGFREKPEVSEQFFREGRSGQWRDVLSRRQIRRIVKAHGEQMERFGYLTADLPGVG